MNSFKRPTFNELHMANQENLLDQRLTQVEDRAQRIRAAAQEPVERARDNEQWWAHMVNYFGSEAVMFERCCIDRRVFDEVYALVRDTPGQGRGRRSVIQTNREKLLFLLIFLSRGVGVLEVLVAPFIKNREHVTQRAKAFARLFRPNIVEGTVRYFDETHDSLPGASLVVDCTVCETTKPKGSFEKAKYYFSGKHWFYAIKKEVCVNIRSGTAALVSRGYPGSKHDIAILRTHADLINNTLQGRSILGDLGYRGAEHDIPSFIVCGERDALRSRRVIVECFFGRLKSLWSVFARAWTLERGILISSLISPAALQTSTSCSTRCNKPTCCSTKAF